MTEDDTPLGSAEPVNFIVLGKPLQKPAPRNGSLQEQPPQKQPDPKPRTSSSENTRFHTIAQQVQIKTDVPAFNFRWSKGPSTMDQQQPLKKCPPKRNISGQSSGSFSRNHQASQAPRNYRSAIAQRGPTQFIPQAAPPKANIILQPEIMRGLVPPRSRDPPIEQHRQGPAPISLDTELSDVIHQALPEYERGEPLPSITTVEGEPQGYINQEQHEEISIVPSIGSSDRQYDQQGGNVQDHQSTPSQSPGLPPNPLFSIGFLDQFNGYMREHEEERQVAEERWRNMTLEQWAAGKLEMMEKMRKIVDMTKTHMKRKMDAYHALHDDLEVQQVSLNKRRKVLDGLQKETVQNGKSVLARLLTK